MASKKEMWSAKVTKESHALELKAGVFQLTNPKKIARSLKRSAQRSAHRKARPFQSAMSMLNLYIIRAGKHLSPERKEVLERAKVELRNAFHR